MHAVTVDPENRCGMLCIATRLNSPHGGLNTVFRAINEGVKGPNDAWAEPSVAI